jgi:heat shock protein HtpX
VFLFLGVNILVMITLITIVSVLGLHSYITPYGIDYQQLAGFCLVWGMGGAFISLGISRIMAKMFMGVKVIPADTTDPTLRQLLQTVDNLRRGANIPMPEVGIYQSPEVNAFATGPTKSRSLVAVSTGLLQRMNRGEVEGVLGHEIAHIANGDMVTMTLIQGVVNAFAMFLARAIAYAVAQALRGRDDEGEGGISFGIYFIIHIVLEILFMILGSIVVAWFSRAREFRADTGGAQLAGRDNMVGALKALQRNYERIDPNAQPAAQTLKISGQGKLMHLFATHPPLDVRIQRLQGGAA